MRVAAAVSVFVFLACGKRDVDATPDGSAAAKPKVTSVKPKPPWPADVPDRSACTTHEDCTVLMHGALLPPDPCCEQHAGFTPVTRAYAEAVSRFRAAHCAGVTCPAGPLPVEPACCTSIGRCVNAKCILGCDDPTLDAPKVVWLAAECRARAQRP